MNRVELIDSKVMDKLKELMEVSVGCNTHYIFVNQYGSDGRLRIDVTNKKQVMEFEKRKAETGTVDIADIAKSNRDFSGNVFEAECVGALDEAIAYVKFLIKKQSEDQ